MLIECPECNGRVSDKASVCPHCGCPVEKRVELGNCKNPVSGIVCDDCGCDDASITQSVSLHKKGMEYMEGPDRKIPYSSTRVEFHLCRKCKAKWDGQQRVATCISWCVSILGAIAGFAIGYSSNIGSSGRHVFEVLFDSFLGGVFAFYALGIPVLSVMEMVWRKKNHVAGNKEIEALRDCGWRYGEKPGFWGSHF